jgi:hypothetical protein
VRGRLRAKQARMSVLGLDKLVPTAASTRTLDQLAPAVCRGAWARVTTSYRPI